MINKGATQNDLNFGMNLRNYKNSTAFKGDEPWLYPAPKVFNPSTIYEEQRRTSDLKDKNIRASKFEDKLAERNANELSHLTGIGGAPLAQWHCSLRGDRQPRKIKKEQKQQKDRYN